MDFLKLLLIDAQNSGVSTGAYWSNDKTQGEIISENPATGKAIASIYRASIKDYEKVVAEAKSAFLSWREVPAPKRGEIVELGPIESIFDSPRHQYTIELLKAVPRLTRSGLQGSGPN